MTAGPALDRRRAALVLVAFFLGGAVPIQLVTISFGYAQYVRGIPMGPQVLSVAHEFAEVYIPFVWLPALALLVGLTLYARKSYPEVTRRVVVGLAAGAIGTVALDAVRQAGVLHGWLPGDTPVMFGKMATGSADFAVFYPVGLFGYNFSWPGLFLLTLVAHVFFGVAMGLLVPHWLRDEDRGWLGAFVRGRARSDTGESSEDQATGAVAGPAHA